MPSNKLEQCERGKGKEGGEERRGEGGVSKYYKHK